MIRFLETFFRHRLLVSVPILLGALVAVGYALTQPRMYEARASLWVDASGPGNQTAATPADQYVQPADKQAAVLHELLSTRSFDIAVASRGPLAAYVEAHPDQQKGLAAIPWLGNLFTSRAASLDDRIATQLPGDVAIAVEGPQVVSLTVQEPTGDVAVGTAKALVDQFSAEILATKTASAEAASSYYANQVAGAQATLQQAQSQLTQYLAAHPPVAANVLADPAAAALSQTSDLALRRYETLLDKYEQARLDLANVANQGGFHVIDEPSVPSSTPVGFKKAVLLAAIGGGLAGIMVSLMALLILTAADRSARRAGDIERSLGLMVVATVPDLSTGPTRLSRR